MIALSRCLAVLCCHLPAGLLLASVGWGWHIEVRLGCVGCIHSWLAILCWRGHEWRRMGAWLLIFTEVATCWSTLIVPVAILPLAIWAWSSSIVPIEATVLVLRWLLVAVLLVSVPLWLVLLVLWVIIIVLCLVILSMFRITVPFSITEGAELFVVAVFGIMIHLPALPTPDILFIAGYGFIITDGSHCIWGCGKVRWIYHMHGVCLLERQLTILLGGMALLTRCVLIH